MSRKRLPVFSMAMVVTGNLIGAGILALPVKTGLSGLLPSLAGIAATWLMMLSTALILSRQKSLTESETADMPSFFQQELGTAGKWISVVANLIILYGLLVAYLSGAGAVLHGLFGRESSMTLWMVAFFLPATGLTLFGTRIMARGTTVFMILMWLAFLVMAAATLGRADVANYGWMDWRFLPTALPVAVTAFHFHNIIPTICRNLEHDRAAISRAMFLGTLIGLVMNVVWVVAVIGALPLEDGGHSLLSAFQRNLPATVPLQKILNSPTFTLSASLFALLAITTSYMANGTALSSFLRDLCANAPGIGGRGCAALLAFAPPLVVALVEPNIFLSALDVVGGVGIDLIFGILPGVLLIKHGSPRARPWGWALVAAFAFVLLFELGQEAGLLHIRPEVEHWNSHLPK